MSLISDPDYLIHNLRLAYLRHLEDPYGPRIIRSGPRYLNNPHVLAAGLADSERWPELNFDSSPDPSEDDEPKNRPAVRRMRSGYPSTGGSSSLKHTQTIMGKRSGALGMRVNGKRSSNSTSGGDAPMPMRPNESNLGRVRADSEPTPLPATPASPPVDLITPGSPDTYDGVKISVSKRRSAGGSSLSEVASSILVKPDTPAQVPQEPVAPRLLTMPSFSKIADMQARRTRRRAHFSSAGNKGRPVVTSQRPINPDMSSSDEAAGAFLDDDGFDRISEHGDGMEPEMEEFDPDFAPAKIGAGSDMSEADSSAPHLINIQGASLEAIQPPQSNALRGVPSPVVEDGGEHRDNGHSRSSRSSTEHSDSTAQMPATKKQEHDPDPNLTRQKAALSARRRTRRMTLINSKTPPPPEAGLFMRLKTLPPRQTTSALTAKLAASSTSTNPFTETYALISGRAEVASMTVHVFFPRARSPSGKPLEIKVRKDATFEELIGFALWSYWEEAWLPKLDEGLDGADEGKKKARLSAAGWILRIAEDDGEIDEDFPAPDRMGKISKFNLDAYAIVEANAAQQLQNQQLESKITRRPSRIIVAKKKSEPAVTLAPAPSMGPSSSTLFPTALGSSFGISASLGLSSSHGPQVLLRIAVEDGSDAVHYSTTISVPSTMYMQEVLENVCRKWKIEDTKDWALLAQERKILVLLDRTVASLEGNYDLVLVRRASLPQYGFPVDGDKRYGRSTDPNASIFNMKRMSEMAGRGKYADTGMQVIAAYKRYTVYRKVPMLVARLVRTLAIDGDYIHIMPSANKAKGVFDSGKTYSYHIKSVHSVQCSKASAVFKLVFRRDMGDKRYDFEAESAQVANEIVSTIRGLKASLDRNSTVNKQRRSRHWKEP